MPHLAFYSGLFLITSCTLMLQVIQTRILSVVAWYHLAFFAISMAMFGLTAGAVWVYLRGDRFTEKTLSYDLAYFSSAFALCTVLCLIAQMTLAPVTIRSLTAIWTWVELAICMSIPFFFSGIVVSLALTRSPFPVGRVYGIDLLGAAAGCLGVLLILNSTDAPSGVIWVGALAAAGALLFSLSRIGEAPAKRSPLDSLLRRHKAILGTLIILAFANGISDYGLQPLVAKSVFEDGRSYIFRDWNSFSRVVVGPTIMGAPIMWGPSPKAPPNHAEQRYMNIDGDAATIATRFNGDLKSLDFLKYDVTNLAYHLPDRKRAAIIGVGGGRDILSAAQFGFRDITGVEINPVFVNLLVREPGFADFTNFDKVEGVKFFVDEGRSWFARSDQLFDVIQMSLIDTWAATGAGAFSLSENGLYTVEAWKIFFDRLTEKGVYTVSRWYNPTDPAELARILSLAVATLMQEGVSEPQRHIVVAAQGKIATMLLSRTAFSASDLSTLENVAAGYEHRVLVSPKAKPDSEVLANILGASNRETLDRYTSGFRFDLTPPTDDRPFFFNHLPLNKPIEALQFFLRSDSAGIRSGNLFATATLIILFLVSLVLVLATIVIPLRPAIKDVGAKLTIGGTLYFLFIGIGFMMVEIGLLQRTSVFLGHPIYSLSVLLFTLILATGIGSLLSDRLKLDTRSSFALWAIMTAGYIIALPLWFSHVFPSFESATLLVRAGLCIATIAPAGILMGFAFPTGMRLISSVDRKPTPWFWGINGAAGVLASTFAVACSIAFGISVTLLIGGVFYLLLIPTALSLLGLKVFRSNLLMNDAAPT